MLYTTPLSLAITRQLNLLPLASAWVTSIFLDPLIMQYPYNRMVDNRVGSFLCTLNSLTA